MPDIKMLAKLKKEAADTVQKTITVSHNPSLINEQMVIQIWADGEITSQKGGELMWSRTLHTISPPIEPKVHYSMPISYGDSSYAVVTMDAAKKIRRLMSEVIV